MTTQEADTAATRLTAVVQEIVRTQLARDPQRFARILAEAETAAWAEVTAAIKETMKAAILAQLEATVTPPLDAPNSDGVAVTVAATALPPPAPDDTAPPPAPEAPSSAGASPAATPAATPVAAQEAGAGIYVYGVIARGAVALPVIAGVADDTAVRLHEVGALAAVVSDVPLCEFGQGALEANLSDLAWLERSVRRHQAVQDQVLTHTALAPMKFATIYLSAAGLETWLTEQQPTLTALLTALHNRQEWGLKVLVDRTVLAEHVAAYSETLRDLRTQMEGKTKGAAYFLVRRIQEVTAEEVERVSFGVADEVHRALEQQSVAAVLNALPAEDVEPNVQMVLNSAYLLADAQVAAAQAMVQTFAAEHGDNGFTFYLTGPWPAYNFVAMAPVAEESDDDA